MKKVLFVAFMVMAFVALGSMAAFACGEDKATKSADATKIDAKPASATTVNSKAAGCCASKSSTTSASATSANATMVSSKTTTANGAACTVADKAACAAKLTNASMASAEGKCTIEDCLKACQAKHAEICGEAAATHHLTAMSVKGMTCGGCETSVKTALMAVEGVTNVIDVCHKAGFAVVCVKNDAKVNNESFIKAVSAKGFESEIIPAVSVTTTTNTTEKAECSAHKKDGSK